MSEDDDTEVRMAVAENQNTSIEVLRKLSEEYIEIFYNRKRLHSSNNYMSPIDYEAKMLQTGMAA